MIFQYQTTTVPFAEADKNYIENSLGKLAKLLNHSQDDRHPDSIVLRITLKPLPQSAGDRVEGHFHLTASRDADFAAQVKAHNIQQCVDLAQTKLRSQIEKYRTTHNSH